MLGVTGGRYLTLPITLFKIEVMSFFRFISAIMGSYSPILSVDSILGIIFHSGLLSKFFDTILLVAYFTNLFTNESGVTHTISLLHPGHLFNGTKHFPQSKIAQISHV